MSLDELNKCKKRFSKRFSEQWIKVLTYHSGDYESQIASKHYSEQKHSAFIKKHFAPIWYEIITNGWGQKVAKETCLYNDSEKKMQI